MLAMHQFFSAGTNGYRRHMGEEKPRNVPTGWLSLQDHSHDVAAVFEALLDLPTTEARLAALAERTVISPRWRARLCVLAFLHDFGKVNHKFQRGEGGHIHEAMFVMVDATRWQASGLDALAEWAARPDELVVTLLSHHGSPPALPTRVAATQMFFAGRRGSRTPVSRSGQPADRRARRARRCRRRRGAHQSAAAGRRRIP